MTRLIPFILLLTGCSSPSHVERISRQLSENNASWTYTRTTLCGSVTISRVNPLFGMSATAGDIKTIAPTNLALSVNYQVAVPPISQTQPPQPPKSNP